MWCLEGELILSPSDLQSLLWAHWNVAIKSDNKNICLNLKDKHWYKQDQDMVM